MPNTEWIHDLKVAELKDECRKRGLAVSGKKAELVERLLEHVQENEKSPSEEPATKAREKDPGADADEQPMADGEEEEEEEQEEPTAAAAAEEAEEPAVPPAESQEGSEKAKEAEEDHPAVAREDQQAAMEAEQPAEPAAVDEAAAKAAEGKRAPPATEPEQPAAAMDEDAPASTKEVVAPAPASAAVPPPAPSQLVAPAPAAAADVDLDYGEDSEGEGAPATAEQQQQREEAEQGNKADAGSKRKREEEAGGASRGKAAGAGAEGVADRPVKVPRSGSGFGLGNAEKGAAPAQEDVPAASEPTTRALRIDGFVRPFTERQVRELLSETGQVLAMWMPSIKTHCYAVFESKEQAETTRRATYQLQWPATNPKRLAPRFVSLSEAETAIGTGAGNPDFRLKRTEEDGEEEQAAAAEEAMPAAKDPKQEAAVPDRSQREWNRNRRSPSPPLEGVRDLREMLSRRLSGRSSDAGAAAAMGAAAAAAASARSPRAAAERELPPGIGLPPERRHDRERELERRHSGRGGEPRPEDRVLTLDELFKKTTSKPCIYWLPLTDEQVAEKRKAAEAAAAAAAAGGQKAAENGTAAAN